MFDGINVVVLAICVLLCLAPFIHILAISFSSNRAVTSGEVSLLPVEFDLQAYRSVFSDMTMIRSLGFTVLLTVLSTALCMLMTVAAAYPLTKKALKGRRFVMVVILITMFFSGGIIPEYILVKNLHLLNTIWALVLPGAVQVFNMILLMNFFRTTPKELEEAAFIDGAGHFRILTLVYLPLALPALATLSLFSIVGNWNAWFDGLLYINDYRNYPLATFLQTIIVQQDFNKITPDINELKNISQRTVKAEQIFIGMLPVLVVYPYLQRYFVKGLTLGGVKG
ncbi:MAG: carbohydrate ABC transporter permease [Gorillibacterium sp.]|nr:carbohydrate ABC transporter permease [Gorillibacterium sp.]